ncbi:serine/threonine-protein kinase [Paraliomyxa miuraensis]|uniref:serine/threonine-protein kinase n=1 Tax=Paraliomyxa miuraensis TaxID=376150 RepID=UPI00225BB3C0|nr:serine/threonine-protein kinase [Paraliomyxa miuraensis]MCX4240148.1 protein kinase [Paraliomyxa miuraensis]
MTTQMPAFHDADELPPNTSLLGGRLVIDVRIGGGGAATVYAATTDDGRDVAIKIMSTAHAELPTSRQRFRNEVMLAQQLAGHPGVVVPYELGELPELDGLPYITMPLVKGAPLLLEAGRLPVVKAVTVLRDLARILADVHEQGIVHRDIKPSNVLVREHGGELVPYLIDFGLATSTGEGAAPSTAGLTAAHELPGTKHYMAPEQILGAKLDPRFDVYALGVTMFEVLTGVLPLHELPPAEAARRKCDPNLPPLSIAGKVPGLPEELERVIDATLEREPGRRTPTAAIVAEQLDGVLEVLSRRPKPRVVPVVPEVPERTLTQAIPPQMVAAGLYEYRAREREGELQRATVVAERVATRSSMEIPVAAAPRVSVERQGVQAGREPRRSRAAAWVVGATVLVLAVGVGAAFMATGGDGSGADGTTQQQVIPAAGTGIAASGTGLVGEDAAEERLAPADVGTTDPGDEGGDDGEANAAAPDVCPACPESDSDSDSEPAPKGDEPRKIKKPRQPRPTPEPKPTPAVEPPCTDVDAEAQAANDARQWSRVLKLTKSPRCWKDDGTREWLRVRAFSQTDRYAECAEIGAASRNPEAKRLGKSCASQLDQEKKTP